jgi:hypothetical protein
MGFNNDGSGEWRMAGGAHGLSRLHDFSAWQAAGEPITSNPQKQTKGTKGFFRFVFFVTFCRSPLATE